MPFKPYLKSLYYILLLKNLNVKETKIKSGFVINLKKNLRKNVNCAKISLVQFMNCACSSVDRAPVSGTGCGRSIRLRRTS